MNLNDLRASDRNNWPSFLLEVASNYTSDTAELTIIIPSFNAADFISETLIRVREIPHAQILVMDDGSTDQTVEIASKLLENHPNYAVLILEHQGSPGQGRNLGASLATGGWLWFLDCDDIPLQGNFSEMLQVAQEFSSDIIIFRYLIRNDYEKFWEMSFDHDLFSSLTKSNYRVIKNWAEEPKLIRLSPHPSRIIFSKEFVIGNGLNYDVNENFEDGSYWPRAMQKANKILTWNWPQVVYRVRHNSITYSQELGRKLFLLSQFKKIFRDEEFKKVAHQNLWGPTYLYAIEMISWPLNSLNGRLRREYKHEARKTIYETGGHWFGCHSNLSVTERFSLFKSFMRMGCLRFGISCLVVCLL